jgi:hypothetical protein
MNGVSDLGPGDLPGVLAYWAGRADTYVGQADGRRIVDFESFFRVVGEALGASREFLEPNSNTAWFYDDLVRLDWFEDGKRYQQYVLVLRHADEIRLPNQYDYRGFFEDVAHFWGEEVVHVVVEGKKRGFVTYLVHE